MISGKLTLDNDSLKNTFDNIRRKLAKISKRKATQAYVFAQANTAVYTGFLQGNWRVTLGLENLNLYGQYKFDGDTIIRTAGDSSEKIFFRESQFRYQTIYITNPTPYARDYNQGRFKESHKNIVGRMKRDLLS